jgi:hypothetical protein
MKGRLFNGWNICHHKIFYYITTPSRYIIETLRETLGGPRLMIHRFTGFPLALTLTQLVLINYIKPVGPAVVRILNFWIAVVALGFICRLISRHRTGPTPLVFLAKQAV